MAIDPAPKLDDRKLAVLGRAALLAKDLTHWEKEESAPKKELLEALETPGLVLIELINESVDVLLAKVQRKQNLLRLNF